MKTTICSRFLLSGILWWLFVLTGSKGSVQLGAGFHGDHGRFLTDYVCKCLRVWFSLTFSSQPMLVKWILSLFCWRSRTLSMPLGVLGIWGSQPYFYRPIFTWWVMWSILSGWQCQFCYKHPHKEIFKNPHNFYISSHEMNLRSTGQQQSAAKL